MINYHTGIHRVRVYRDPTAEGHLILEAHPHIVAVRMKMFNFTVKEI